ncbi:hypothetical protein NEPTK9_001213 [Candidatus Neptunochlamydia vexilliferae]|uniref:Uncharacterized protein n=1 Tax=Candidatus Neptunichlamydia vexilliferae TaxID=1651774 RepID=A0ABS0B010_9BACT|nr:hypothetical protein [Candidatus Neptunochlamydia vexilliferae]
MEDLSTLTLGSTRMRRSQLLRLDSGDGDCIDDIIDKSAPRKVIDRFFEPLKHGANGKDIGTSLDRLVGRIGGVEVGENIDGGLPSNGTVGRFFCRNVGAESGIILKGAIDKKVGAELFDFCCRLLHFGHICPGSRGSGAVADHGYPRGDPKPLSRIGTLDGDISKLFSCRVLVDGAISIDKDLVGEAHEENRRNFFDTRLGFNELESGADRTCCCVDRSGN